MSITQHEISAEIIQIEYYIHSIYLKRTVQLTLIYPKKNIRHLNLLIFNDGQDFAALQIKQSIYRLFSENKIQPVLCVGVHANQERLQEYGTASQVDYKKRGGKAQQNSDFIIHELIPYLEQVYSLKKENRVIAGFSLGGLSAMDIAWNHPKSFTKVGVFSGALWWRQKSEEEGYSDENDRIIHNIVKNGQFQPNQQFWFQAGTNDETSDRNNNGIIDAIDDTLDLIKVLEKHGYQSDKDIVYREVEGGEHNTKTWSFVMPEFLIWAIGR
jgi:iron(III)-enterobactin esterase